MFHGCPRMNEAQSGEVVSSDNCKQEKCSVVVRLSLTTLSLSKGQTEGSFTVQNPSASEGNLFMFFSRLMSVQHCKRPRKYNSRCCYYS